MLAEFGDVGFMTGDVTISPNASCLVMTTEVRIVHWEVTGSLIASYSLFTDFAFHVVPWLRSGSRSCLDPLYA